MIESLLKGVVLGLSLAAPPGPVNAVIAFKSLERAKKGISVGLGALTADLTYMLIILSIRAVIPEWALRLLSFVGSAFMAFIALRIILRIDGGYGGSVRDGGRPSYGREYSLGLAMGLTNPFQITWWLTVGLTLVASFGYAILIGFIIGVISWVTSFSYLVSLGRASASFVRAVRYVSGAILLIFAMYILARAIA